MILEAIYWLGLATTAYYEVKGLFFGGFGHPSLTSALNLFGTSVLPSVLESIAVPIVLLIFAYKVSPTKPLKGALRWGLISGTLIILEFWLTNTGEWIDTVQVKGTSYLTAYPGNMVSFIITAFGLLALGIYASIFIVQSRRAELLEDLNLRAVGVIVLSLGMFFLWNYLTWIWFNYPWSEQWDAWFLGHNLDLWMLSLPLLGLPLLFTNKLSKKKC